jgi:cell division ATPase FtsA
MAWDFCTPDQVVELRHFQAENIKDNWSNAVESLIRQHVNAPYLGTTETITNELHSGDNNPIIMVKKPPIYTFTELRVSSTALVSTDYVSFDNYVMLTGGMTFPSGVLNVAIDYVSGSDVDSLINMTAIAMLTAFINYQQRYGADTSLIWEDTTEVGENTPNLNVGLTSHLMQIMKRMLRKRALRIR